MSRLLLFKKLIKCGIGYTILNALKSVLSCILTIQGKYSPQFNTTCYIRQGAPSSSLSFLIFINDLIDYVRNRCVNEPLIEAMHLLLHADDTLIVSTGRLLFKKKCNIMLDYFMENKLRLDLGKSGYLLINGKRNDKKITIYLQNGPLEYKNEIMYLGIIISDTGGINNDINLFIKEKRSNISVKYTNFCARNYLAPLSVKLSVLHSCVISS